MATMTRWFRSFGGGAAARLLRVAGAVDPRARQWAAGVVLLAGIVPFGFLLASAWLVGLVPDAARDGLGSSAGRRLWLALGVSAALYLVQQVVVPALQQAAALRSRRFDQQLGDVIVLALADVDVDDREMEPAFSRAAATATTMSGRHTPGAALDAWSRLTAVRLYGVLCSLLLLRAGWMVPLVLLAAAAVQYMFWSRRLAHAASGVLQDTAFTRRAAYLRDLLVLPAGMKEVRFYGIRFWLSQRWQELQQPAQAEQRAGSTIRDVGSVLAVSALITAVQAGVMLWLVDRSLDGRLTLEATVALLSAVVGVVSAGMVNEWLPTIAEGAASLPDPATLASPPRAEFAPEGPPARSPSPCVSLHSCSYRYPGSAAEAVKNVDVSIAPGSSLGLVGRNGAGKSTLVKLLCGLVQPTTGTLRVDGRVVGGEDAAAWRRSCAALLQDFVKFELSLRENVVFGPHAERASQAALDEIAELVGLGELISRLPRGWDTVLSASYRGGVDLSGGEWQRVALARAMFAKRNGARLLILDEPTASLDAAAEEAFYERFFDLTRDVATVVVSHRFPSVRKAGSILVLNDGAVVEAGSHEELISRNGLYAQLFAAQAAGYRTGVVS